MARRSVASRRLFGSGAQILLPHHPAISARTLDASMANGQDPAGPALLAMFATEALPVK